MRQWYCTLDVTVPKYLLERSKFVLVTKFGVCVELMVMYHMQIYQGKQSNAIDQPLGTRFIKNMVYIISSNSNVLYHPLYLDNFFFSYHLMTELAEKSIRTTGTIRENKTEGANKQLVQNKELQKQERGTYGYCSDRKAYIAKWLNDSAVNNASNSETHKPVRKVKHRIKRKAKKVTQAHLIGSCNKGIGGIDLMDRLLESYRSTIRGKNSTGSLFVNFLNNTVVAA